MTKPDGSGFAMIDEGWQIHINHGDKWKGLPSDSYAALGAMAQGIIFVAPSLNLVIARNGAAPIGKNHIEEILAPIVEAVIDRPVRNETDKHYFPPPESQRGWRKNTDPTFVRSVGMNSLLALSLPIVTGT